jgi:uncharacterized phage-associated protein
MATAYDVVNYIESQKLPGGTDMKLHKLAYYAQAWHIVWEGRPLFADKIEAWQHGPVPAQGWRTRRYSPETPAQPLTDDERSVVDAVLDFYGGMTAGKLRNLSHDELPWNEARGDKPADANAEDEITVSSMRRYFTRKSMSGESVPHRRSPHEPMPTDRVLAIAEEEAPRWRETLARLAE